MKMFKKNIVLFLLILILASLLIWFKAPLYPDELAFRISKLRYINDRGALYNLYGLCNLEALNLPNVFIPAAWILSLLSNGLNPLEMRVLTVLTLLTLTCSLIKLTKSRINKSSIYFVSLAFIGVAGSGLIIVRHEFITLLLIAICIFSVSLNFKNYTKTKYIILILSILFCSTFSGYIHPQGLLFIPLVVYSVLEIANKIPKENFLRFIIKIISILFLIFLTYHSIAFNKIGCTNSEEINNDFNNMIIDWSDINGINFLIDKIILYSNSFLYKSEYLSNYLPGVIDNNNRIFLESFNSILIFILVSIVILNFIYLINILMQIIFIKFNEGFLTIIRNNGLFVCMSIPGIFLLLYDKNQYFYRSIFINVLLCSSIVIFNSSKLSFVNKYLETFIKFFGPIILFISILINYKLFFNMLPNWNAIYSVSIKNKLIDRKVQINSLINRCNLNINNSKFAVDEYTYEYFKNTLNPQIIYYISYQAIATNKTIPDILNLLKINSVVASCSAMKRSGVGWPADFSENQICCFNLQKIN